MMADSFLHQLPLGDPLFPFLILLLGNWEEGKVKGSLIHFQPRWGMGWARRITFCIASSHVFSSLGGLTLFLQYRLIATLFTKKKLKMIISFLWKETVSSSPSLISLLLGSSHWVLLCTSSIIWTPFFFPTSTDSTPAVLETQQEAEKGLFRQCLSRAPALNNIMVGCRLGPCYSMTFAWYDSSTMAVGRFTCDTQVLCLILQCK